MDAVQVIINVSGEDILITASKEEVERAVKDPQYARDLALSRREGPENPGLSMPVEEGNAVWDRASVLALLGVIKERGEEKKKVNDRYTEIASELAGMGCKYSVQQVRSKADALKRRYKQIKDHKNKSGNGAAPHWEFFEMMDEIYRRQAWVAPRATASSTAGPSTSGGAMVSTHNGTTATMKKRKMPEEMMEDMYKKLNNDRDEMREEMRVREEEKERRKQARHEEKMELRQQFLALMERAVRGGEAL